ncbi:hypothetical protein MTP99_018613 [Tenebrio molitor]|nr:hypothetical protein MTP99_018613 [Tenebrio molitor]
MLFHHKVVQLSAEDVLSSSHNGHSTNGCHRICTNKDYGTVYNEDKRLGFLRYRLPNSEKQIQMEMMSHGPVAAVMTVYKDFFFYKEGVYKHFAVRCRQDNGMG